jgi:hypothetical protein
MPSVKEEICRLSHRYYTRLTTHPNDQVLALLAAPGTRRLRRNMPNDLPEDGPRRPKHVVKLEYKEYLIAIEVKCLF